MHWKGSQNHATTTERFKTTTKSRKTTSGVPEFWFNRDATEKHIEQLQTMQLPRVSQELLFFSRKGGDPVISVFYNLSMPVLRTEETEVEGGCQELVAGKY